jgi:hypothetical protein
MRYVALRGSDRWYVVSALRKLAKVPAIVRVPPILNNPFMQGSTAPRKTLWYVQQALDRVRQLPAV